MREIKFRCYEPSTKIMFIPPSIPNPTNSPDRTGGILTEYTGLKDKKGIEIYEGDIVSNRNEGRGTIEWINNGWKYKILQGYKSRYSYRTFDELTCTQDDIEVIGNIYESKQLLGQVDQ